MSTSFNPTASDLALAHEASGSQIRGDFVRSARVYPATMTRSYFLTSSLRQLARYTTRLAGVRAESTSLDSGLSPGERAP